MEWKRFKFQLPYGDISVASLLIAAVSGVIIAINYDVTTAYNSISKIMLLNPSGSIMRNIHYWSAQLFLISTILHIYDHLKKNSESQIKSGVWLRLTISIAAVFFVMLSGFILKGDADSLQAFRIFDTLINQIPFAGKTVSRFLIGDEQNFQIVYVQHIALSTIFLFLITFEHSGRIWTSYKVFFITGAICLAFGLVLNAPLHDNINPIIKGPWYFLGLQEILHWMSSPAYVLVFSFFLFLVFFAFPKLLGTSADINNFENRNYKITSNIKKGFLIISAGYLFLTLFAFFFRGENWKFEFPWNITAISGINFNSYANIDSLAFKNIPVILGRNEGCLYCHDNVTGLSASHDFKSIGCQSCHSGNPFTLDKTSAHNGMIISPGDLSNADRACGTANCHPDITLRVGRSIMNTMSGIVSVDKYAFGEINTPSLLSDIKNIKFSPAEKHLRNLCASCHLGTEKKETGEINELSRGGGCLACHLNYSDSSALEIKNSAKILHNYHPDLNLKISDNHCFGCHSRSGRISTNYEGWFETEMKPEEVKGKDEFRVLMDDRVFEKHEADVHFDMGMECIDCHLSGELMGDGNLYMHKEEQVKIQCSDCHVKNSFRTGKAESLNSEEIKIIGLRKYPFLTTKYLLISFSGFPFTNIYFDSINSPPVLFTKNTGLVLPLKKTLPVCSEGDSHKRLSCNSCHTSRVSQCITCHTEYNKNSIGFDLLDNKERSGEWVEHSGGIYNELPALGIRINKKENGEIEEIVETFIPGMILTIDETENKTITKRFYAPIRAHTTTRSSRSCKSCHNNPIALGYGRGELIYNVRGEKGNWIFYPAIPVNKTDGLPSDAWVGFLQTRNNDFSTRANVRSFSTEEQKRILTVGACLNCHEDESKIMKESLIDFQRVIKRLNVKCIIPEW